MKSLIHEMDGRAASGGDRWHVSTRSENAASARALVDGASPGNRRRLDFRGPWLLAAGVLMLRARRAK